MAVLMSIWLPVQGEGLAGQVSMRAVLMAELLSCWNWGGLREPCDEGRE
jgi:hypothetical protein